MATTARFKKRKKALKKLFEDGRVKSKWKDTVWEDLRMMDIPDLFDYYDINLFIDDEVSNLKSKILTGEYGVSKPIYYKLEKKFGICRHMVIPSPRDTLVLQVLCDEVSRSIIKKQPSSETFFLRRRHKKIKNIHEVSRSDSQEDWIALWRKYQKEILNFTNTYPKLAHTDITNFYDNIDIGRLRDYLSSMCGVDEIYLDIIFLILNGMCWVPDYMQGSSKFLPTSHVECVRLFAHAFLFEVDEVLENETRGDFARWMDDIVFGSDSYSHASNLLSGISEVLKSRGLALNASKTSLISSEEAKFHYQFQENIELDELDLDAICDDELLLKFLGYYNKKNDASVPKSWDQIVRRYMTMLGKKGAKIDDRILFEIIVKYPGIRHKAFSYLTITGCDYERIDLILKLVNKKPVYDDTYLIALCRMLTEWNVTPDQEGIDFINTLDRCLEKHTNWSNSKFDFFSLLWFRSKYYSPNKLFEFLKKSKNLWMFHEFLQRQVTAVIPRMMRVEPEYCKTLLSEQSASSLTSVSVLAGAINQIMRTDNFKAVTPYILPSKLKRFYGLQRYLVLCSCLENREYRERFISDKNLKNKLIDKMNDDFFLYWINKYYFE